MQKCEQALEPKIQIAEIKMNISTYKLSVEQKNGGIESKFMS